MNSRLKKLITTILTVCLMFLLAQTALAAGQFKTTDGVNFRTGPSTGHTRIRGVAAGTKIEMLEHDPAGWSRIRIDGTDGYIRSDFLQFEVTEGMSVIFETTDGVNFRTGPSTHNISLRVVVAGTQVEMLEHDPAGWSKIMINKVTGYIRSDYLAWVEGTSAIPDTGDDTAENTDTDADTDINNSEGAGTDADEEQSDVIDIRRTVTAVNFRTGSSTSAGRIKLIGAGEDVEVLADESNGWSRVRIGDTEGYIKSELLIAIVHIEPGDVELLDWSVAKDVIKTGVPLHIVDVRTGLSFTMQCFSKSGHADVEPLTAADTAVILRSRDGVWAWDPRPVWVTIDGRTIAASLNGVPHDVSTIRNNGMNGHLCLHFNNTVTNNKSYQRDLNDAVIEAWNASR